MGDGSLTNPFARIADGMAAAAVGDTVMLAAGTYSETVSLVAYGQPRLALLALKQGVTVIGAGRSATFLHALPAAYYTFGITASGVDASASVSDLAVTGVCFQAVNLRGASPRLSRLDLVNAVTGGSSVAGDFRDYSSPVVEDVLFDGGHTALVVEFGSGGTYTGCTLGRRPNNGLICNEGFPEFVDTTFLGAGIDVLVFSQGSQPILRDCTIADGDRYAARVALYGPGTQIDLSGNTWFSTDSEVIRTRILDATADPALGATVIIEPLADGGVSSGATNFGSLKAMFR
jgi:hypothetical protein